MIDRIAFTPGSAVAGGLLIGVAAALLVLLNGRIAGVSGIVGGLLRPRGADAAKQGDRAWRIAFLAGLIGAPLAYGAFRAFPPVTIVASYPVLIVAGLLVGIGTRYAGGCTSGHGVCGISRLSLRSLLATLSFMAAGAASVFLMRHVLGVAS